MAIVAHSATSSSGTHRMETSDRAEEIKSLYKQPKANTPLHVQTTSGACPFCEDSDGNAVMLATASAPPCGFSFHGSTKPIQYFTPCQVRRHNTEESAWLVAGNDIYDVTSYMDRHPGGKQSIMRRAGGALDCTQDLHFHSTNGKTLWNKHKIGQLRTCPGATSCKDSKQWWMFWK